MRYEHDIELVLSGNGNQDENGDWITSATPNEVNMKGRYEPADGEGSVFKGDDGNMINYSGIVYMPPDVPEVAVGSLVKVFENGELKTTGRASRFWRYKNYSQLWL